MAKEAGEGLWVDQAEGHGEEVLNSMNDEEVLQWVNCRQSLIRPVTPAACQIHERQGRGRISRR